MAILSAAQQNELYTNMLTKMDKRFEEKSYTEAQTSKEFEFGDNHTITIPTVNHATVSAYDPSLPWYKRTGEAQEITDELNTYTVEHAMTFHAMVDQVPSADQRFIRSLTNSVKDTTDFEIKPIIDEFRLNAWANGAGNIVYGTDADISNKVDASTDKDIIRTILTLKKFLKSKRVPLEGLVFNVSDSLALETRLAQRLQYNDNYTGKLLNGQMAHIDNQPIVALPDEMMPDGVDIMVKWKRASLDPNKGDKMRYLDKVIGSFEHHFEGLYRYDSFVLAQKADGILLFTREKSDGTSTKVCAPVTASIASNALKLTCATTGANIYYSTTTFIDRQMSGKNPKNAKNKMAFSANLAAASFPEGKTIVCAYASKPGTIDPLTFKQTMIDSGIKKFLVTNTSGTLTVTAIN